MELLKKLLPTIRKHLDKFTTRLSKSIFYRIIDLDQSTQTYTLQCVNTRAIFFANIADIIFDKNIIYRLHPIQTCYMGIEYDKVLEKKSLSIPKNYPNTKDPFTNFSKTYRLCSQDRKNNVCFINHHTKEEFIMDPRDIVLSEAVIEAFDSAEAFHIGLLAGLKIKEAREKSSKSYDRLHHPYLRIVK